MKATCALACAALLVGACSGASREAPESARFTEMQVTTAGNVCGYVNAKNKMGGYVGKTPFYYRANGEVAVVTPLEDSDFRSFLWNMTNRDSEKRFADLNQRCTAIRQWKEVCGFGYPGGELHPLCAELRHGNTSILQLILEKEFRR
jgi:hypothetical protein